jgi:branched-chain amino acid transport system substrate-binding protein
MLKTLPKNTNIEQKAKKADRKNIIFSIYVIILFLLGPLIIALGNDDAKLSGKVKSKLSRIHLPNAQLQQSLETRISSGERILITADTNTNKQTATEAYSAGDYQTALQQFQASLAIKPNDPEALIYWNNSLARFKGNTLKLAVAVPIGGNLDVAQEMLRGIAQAQTQINGNGGINGSLIEIEIANDDNEPEIAKQIARELVKDEQVLAVIGHNASRTSFAAAPIYQEGKLVMITSTSSAENLPEIGDYIFRSTPSTRALADVLAEYAINSARTKTIAICADSQEEASASFQEEFIWSVYQLGGQIADVNCDFAAADFNPALIPSEMIGNGADALLLAPSIYKVNQAIEIAKVNHGRLSLLGNHSMNTHAVLERGGAEVNGMVLSVAWHVNQDETDSFVRDALKLWGGGVNWRTAMTYDASQIILSGLKSAATREQLQKTLTNAKFAAPGAKANIEFLPSGERNIRGTLVKIEPTPKSPTGYSFVTNKLIK